MSTNEVIPVVVEYEVHDGPLPNSASGPADANTDSRPLKSEDLLLPFVAGVAFGAFGLLILGLTLADAASRARTLRDEDGDR